jgi:uncharacterized membrane protein YphA (DoxX/SURF4 family)
LNPFKAITAIFSTKASKVIAIVILAGLMTTSSAAVFTQYYANTTATVKAAEVMLMPGTDPTTASALCSVNNATTGAATVGITHITGMTTRDMRATGNREEVGLRVEREALQVQEQPSEQPPQAQV